MSTVLTNSQFQEIARIARDRWGLALTDRKRALVQNRLAKSLVRSPFQGVEQYLDHLRDAADDEDMLLFFDLLSTNTTSFFRESAHFDFLAEEFYPRLRDDIAAGRKRRVRFWSAACSNGSEPYTMAIQALEEVPELDRCDFRILATDLSNKSLRAAKAGVYSDRMMEGVPGPVRSRRFDRVTDGEASGWRVKPEVRRLVAVHQLNLMDRWPMSGPFDVIFLRNVMIYFDLETRSQLVSRMVGLLAPGGVFVIGSAETLSGIRTALHVARPSVYRK